MDCLPDDSSLSIVLICQSRPAQETLNELRFERVTVLTDPAGKLAQSLDVVAFPRLLFVGEGLEVVGARGEVAGELAAGFAAVLAKFAEGTRLEKSDLNLLLTGQQLPMLLDEKKGQEASEIMAASRGPWLVLHFSSTCSGCKVELGELKTTTDSGRHVRVLGVTSSPQEDIDQLLGEVGIVIPVIYDVSGEIRIKHDVSALPTAFVVDEEGSIISKMVGYTEYGFANLVDLCSSE
jgi:peroxiredoxin